VQAGGASSLVEDRGVDTELVGFEQREDEVTNLLPVFSSVELGEALVDSAPQGEVAAQFQQVAADSAAPQRDRPDDEIATSPCVEGEVAGLVREQVDVRQSSYSRS
jgi:hypothetical protein